VPCALKRGWQWCELLSVFAEVGECVGQAVSQVPQSGRGDTDQATGGQGQLGTPRGPHQLTVGTHVIVMLLSTCTVVTSDTWRHLCHHLSRSSASLHWLSMKQFQKSIHFCVDVVFVICPLCPTCPVTTFCSQPGYRHFHIFQSPLDSSVSFCYLHCT